MAASEKLTVVEGGKIHEHPALRRETVPARAAWTVACVAILFMTAMYLSFDVKLDGAVRAMQTRIDAALAAGPQQAVDALAARLDDFQAQTDGRFQTLSDDQLAAETRELALKLAGLETLAASPEAKAKLAQARDLLGQTK